MAITRKNKIARRYNEQLEAAKEAYKAKRGLKVARGFFDTKEAKRIERNKRQAFYRYEKRQDTGRAKGAIKELEKELSDVDKKITDRQFSGKAKAIGQFSADIVIANELFFTALSGGKDVYTAVFDMQEAQAAGEKAKGVVRFYDGTVKTYTDPFQFEKALNRLLKQAEEKQNQEIKVGGQTIKNRTGGRSSGKSSTKVYPTLSYTIFSAGGEEFFVVGGDFDEEAFGSVVDDISFD